MRATAVETGRMVVVRFRDGKLLKGTVHDFTPNKTEFHLYESGDESRRAVTVSVDSLKGLFFVKSYSGNPDHQRDDTFRDGSACGGRKIRVRFVDGEELIGSTMGYNVRKPGFFLVPADAEDNNERVFVINAAVAEVEWL